MVHPDHFAIEWGVGFTCHRDKGSSFYRLSPAGGPGVIDVYIYICVCVCKSIYVDFIHSVKQFAHHFQNPSPKSHSIDLKHAPAADSSKHARGVRYAQPQEIDLEQGKSFLESVSAGSQMHQGQPKNGLEQTHFFPLGKHICRTYEKCRALSWLS